MTKHSIKPFSQDFTDWINSKQPKTLESLINVFNEKSFAILFFLLLALPALPIPTGGLTHITEIIAMFVALQLIIGRKTIWLPKSWKKRDISSIVKGKAASKLISFIQWFEKYSRQRLGWILNNPLSLSLLGIVVLTYTVAAFSAPPFSVLDTLPALGVVIISLGLILEDFIVTLVGIIAGAVGIGLVLAAGAALYSGFTHYF